MIFRKEMEVSQTVSNSQEIKKKEKEKSKHQPMRAREAVELTALRGQTKLEKEHRLKRGIMTNKSQTLSLWASEGKPNREGD